MASYMFRPENAFFRTVVVKGKIKMYQLSNKMQQYIVYLYL